MSHFSLLVITEQQPDEELLGALLQPYHEYECTGDNDQYVQDIDVTEESLEYAKDSHEEGDIEGFVECAASYHGVPIVKHGEHVDPQSEEYRWGWCQLDAEGNIAQIINRTNPNRKWDWWVVGGRWQGYLSPRTDPISAAVVRDIGMVGEKGVMGSSSGRDGFDSLPKKYIDFEGMRATAEAEAAQTYDQVMSAIGEQMKEYTPWAVVRDEVCAGDIEKAREFYNKQAAVVASREAAQNKVPGFDFFMELDDFNTTRDVFIKRAGDQSFCTFTIMRDGKWIERGEMGWFGCVSDAKDDWSDQFAKLLAEIPDEHWLTVMDCHI